MIGPGPQTAIDAVLLAAGDRRALERIVRDETIGLVEHWFAADALAHSEAR